MKDTIRIEIKEHNDFTHPYFLATSPDVEWFLVQGNSVAEVVELVPDILKDFLKFMKELEEEKNFKKQRYIALSQRTNLLMQYVYEKNLPLQLT